MSPYLCGIKIKNDLLLRAIKGEACERPPVWLMRQAGRVLPQYRAVRDRLSGFKELVTTPALAAGVTVQPVDELGVDAAILFSDILVIPEAMGLDYDMVEKRGPSFPKTIKSGSDVDKLAAGPLAAERLGYVYDAIAETKRELNGRVPLLGFSGAPWTLLSYMVEGGGSKTFSKARRLLFVDPQLAHQLLNKITDTIIAYLNEKIKAGVDAVQIFDSWAGVLSGPLYSEFCVPYLSRICDEVTGAPKIIFAKDGWFALADLSQLNCEVLGLDWTVAPGDARKWVGMEKVLQGNLDPCCLYTSTDVIRRNTLQMLQSFGRKHIANLGHGVYPDTPLENVKCFVDTVKDFRYTAEYA
ncbi:MAG: uroporphyrinogen decarboxylase [Saprospiraceae bacterium]